MIEDGRDRLTVRCLSLPPAARLGFACRSEGSGDCSHGFK